mgnify:FL=1
MGTIAEKEKLTLYQKKANNVLKTTGKYRAIAEAAQTSKGVQDIIESDSDDGNVPGPGAYFESD